MAEEIQGNYYAGGYTGSKFQVSVTPEGALAISGAIATTSAPTFIPSGNVFVVSGNQWTGVGSIFAVSGGNAIGQVALIPLQSSIVANRIFAGSPGVAIPSSPLTARRTLLVTLNDGGKTVYLGPSSVLDTTGLPIGSGVWGWRDFSVDIGSNVQLYAYIGTGSADVRYFEVA